MKRVFFLLTMCILIFFGCNSNSESTINAQAFIDSTKTYKSNGNRLIEKNNSTNKPPKEGGLFDRDYGVQIIAQDIIFDSDYNAYSLLKIKNQTDLQVVALEIHYGILDNMLREGKEKVECCDIVKRIKVRIRSGGDWIYKIRFSSLYDSINTRQCNENKNLSAEILSVIFSDGTKYDAPALVDRFTTHHDGEPRESYDFNYRHRIKKK